jgi:hypothetical protein
LRSTGCNSKPEGFHASALSAVYAARLPAVETNLDRVAHQVMLADGLVEVWATTANYEGMLLHVLNAKLAKVLNSRLEGLVALAAEF